MSSGGSRLGGQEASGRASWLDGDAAVPRAAELWTAASAVTPPFIEARRWSAWAGGEGGRGGEVLQRSLHLKEEKKSPENETPAHPGDDVAQAHEPEFNRQFLQKQAESPGGRGG